LFAIDIHERQGHADSQLFNRELLIKIKPFIIHALLLTL
jgi:hypothetical protein